MQNSNAGERATHQASPYDEDGEDVDGVGLSGDGLAEGGDDDDHELDAVHALATDDVREPTEEQLTDEGTDGGGDFDAEVLVDVELAVFVVDVAQHRRGDVDREDVVAAVCNVRRELGHP